MGLATYRKSNAADALVSSRIVLTLAKDLLGKGYIIFIQLRSGRLNIPNSHAKGLVGLKNYSA